MGLDDFEPTGESVPMEFYGYWAWEAPDASTTFEDIPEDEAFPPSDGWQLLGVRPSDGSEPTEDDLRDLVQEVRHGAYSTPDSPHKMKVLMVGKGKTASIRPFDLEDPESAVSED